MTDNQIQWVTIRQLTEMFPLPRHADAVQAWRRQIGGYKARRQIVLGLHFRPSEEHAQQVEYHLRRLLSLTMAQCHSPLADALRERHYDSIKDILERKAA